MLGKALKTLSIAFLFLLAIGLPRSLEDQAVAYSEPIAKAKKMTDVECLASALHYEAGGEGSEGMHAVANVIFNRMKRTKASVCHIIKQRGQFSFVKNGHIPPAKGKFLAKAERFLLLHKKKALPDITNGATFFKRYDVQHPVFEKLEFLTQIGQHQFYK